MPAASPRRATGLPAHAWCGLTAGPSAFRGHTCPLLSPGAGEGWRARPGTGPWCDGALRRHGRASDTGLLGPRCAGAERALYARGGHTGTRSPAPGQAAPRGAVPEKGGGRAVTGGQSPLHGPNAAAHAVRGARGSRGPARPCRHTTKRPCVPKCAQAPRARVSRQGRGCLLGLGLTLCSCPQS